MTSSKNIIDCPSTKRARLDDEISRKRVTGNYLNDSAAVGEHLDHRDQGTEPATGGDGGDSDSETDVLPSDTIVAINYLKAQRLLPPGVAPPYFALKTQLYCVLNDRTVADRELDELRLANAVRVFKLPAGPEDYAIMLTSDYEAAVGACRQEASTSGAAAKQPALLRVFDWFCERVLPRCSEVMITRLQLLKLLGTDPNTNSSQRATPVTDAHLALLLQHGCLTRHVASGTFTAASSPQECFMFSIPGASAALRSVDAGRQELLSLLRRRKHPEMLESALLKQKLRRSSLGVMWHVRDLVGAGVLLRIETTVGPLIRVAKRT